MIDKFKSAIRHSRGSIIIFISLVPCLLFSAINLSAASVFNVVLCVLLSLLTAFLEMIITKHGFEPSIPALSLLAAVSIPGNAQFYVFIICGISLGILLFLSEKIRKYIGFCVPAAAVSFSCLFFQSKTPGDYIVSGHMPENVLVKNLILGNYQVGMMVCSSVICLLACVIILIIARRIRFSDLLFSLLSFGLFVTLLCEGNGISTLTMVSFLLLDGKTFFALGVLALLKGYSLPASSPLLSKLILILNGALAAYLVCSGVSYGAYFSVCLTSLLSLSIEKAAYRFNIRFLKK